MGLLDGASFDNTVNSKLQTLFKAAVNTSKKTLQASDIKVFDKDSNGKFDKAEVTDAIKSILTENRKTINEDRYTGAQTGVENSDESKAAFNDVANMGFYDWNGADGVSQQAERTEQVAGNKRDAAASSRVMLDTLLDDEKVLENISTEDEPTPTPVPDPVPVPEPDPKPTDGKSVHVKVDDNTYIDAPAGSKVDIEEGTGENEGKTIYKVKIPNAKDGKGAHVQVNETSYVDVPAGYEVIVVHDAKTGKDTFKIVPLEEEDDKTAEDPKPEEDTQMDKLFNAFLNLDGVGSKMSYDTDHSGKVDESEIKTAITDYLKAHADDVNKAKPTGENENAQNSKEATAAFEDIAKNSGYSWDSDEQRDQRINEVKSGFRDAKKAILRILAKMFPIQA